MGIRIKEAKEAKQKVEQNKTKQKQKKTKGNFCSEIKMATLYDKPTNFHDKSA